MRTKHQPKRTTARLSESSTQPHGEGTATQPSRGRGETSIYISQRAWSQVEALPAEAARRVLGFCSQLDEPKECSRQLDLQPLTRVDCARAYRLRVGCYRCLFFVEEGIYWIVRIVHRKDAYDGLDALFRREVRRHRQIVPAFPGASAVHRDRRVLA